MSEIEVWAPAARSVELELEGRRIPLQPAERGYHRGEAGDLRHGARYAFRLDGSDPLPDPRSPWQPDGVHGRSAVVDHRCFTWNDAGWSAGELRDQVVYELHTGTFGPEPTFAGVAQRLDHLVDLGITAVELMPVAEFAGTRGWGYDGVDLYAPHHAYGGPEGLQALVDQCHRRGLAVILDVVYNHLGPEGNYLGRFGPYFTDSYRNAWGGAFNYDGRGSAEVRRFVVDNALMWLRDYHFDGLRLDAVHAIFDRSAVHLLEQLVAAVRRLEGELGRRLWLIAESDQNSPRLIMDAEAGGYGLDSQWSDDFHHALHALLTGERDGYYRDFGPIADVAKALRQSYVFDGRYSEHRQRVHGRPPPPLPGERFFAYLQTHDQVGNRAVGERAAHLMSAGLARCGAAIVLCSPFVPMLFQGEEWAASTPFQFFSDHTDPELGRATSEGRVREFQAFGWDPARVPDPQSPATFERSRLDWSELESEPHRDMLAWHRQLIHLRRDLPELHDGRLDAVQVSWSEERRWLLLRRGSVTLAVNLASEPQRLEVGGAVLAASHAGVTTEAGTLTLPGESAAVLRESSQADG